TDRSMPFRYTFLHCTHLSEIYTLSLHDALPISSRRSQTASRSDQSRLANRAKCSRKRVLIPGSGSSAPPSGSLPISVSDLTRCGDRKSTRLNSSHVKISYAVFCLKKKRN